MREVMKAAVIVGLIVSSVLILFMLYRLSVLWEFSVVGQYLIFPLIAVGTELALVFGADALLTRLQFEQSDNRNSSVDEIDESVVYWLKWQGIPIEPIECNAA